MNRKSMILIAGLAVVIIGGIFVYVGSNSGEDKADNNLAADQKTSQAQQSEEMSDDMQMPAGSAQGQGGSDDSQPAAANEVTISNFTYSPAAITVKAGTKVTWTNQDSVRHDVMKDDSSADGPSSELLAKGESYSYTFTKAGTYEYHCSPHPNMKGKVIVTE